jgi:hypothetical protein
MFSHPIENDGASEMRLFAIMEFHLHILDSFRDIERQ